MDVGLSVSRVGGAAQTAATKQVAGRLRIDLAQYQEMAQFVKFGAEVDQATLDQLTRGERGRELLKQGQHAPMPMAHEVVMLFAVTNGLLDEIPLTEVAAFEKGLLAELEHSQPELLSAIATTGDMPPETEAALGAATASFGTRFLTEYRQANGVAVAPPESLESTEAEQAAV